MNRFNDNLIFPMNSVARKVEPEFVFPDNLLVEPTKDQRLFKVSVKTDKKANYIGVVRKEDKGWIPIGGFVFTYAKDSTNGDVNAYFPTKEEAAFRLMVSVDFQWGRGLRR